MNNAVEQAALEDVRAIVESVADPEMPMVSIGEMGMVRGIEVDATGEIQVRISPTFVGCPATEIIGVEVMLALARAGHDRAKVRRELSPPWSPDWISDAGLAKLRENGIAPPPPRGLDFEVASDIAPECPHCGSSKTRLESRFGSTPCKARHVCLSCREPFEQMKPL